MKKRNSQHQSPLLDDSRLDDFHLDLDRRVKMEDDRDRTAPTPSPQTARLQRKRGIWVYHSGEPLAASTVRKTLQQTRRERDKHNLGSA